MNGGSYYSSPVTFENKHQDAAGENCHDKKLRRLLLVIGQF